jgi:hypothetical protein
MRARPSVWLFSGWNWAPVLLPLGNERRHRAAIGGGGNQVVRIFDGEMVGMDEIGVQPILTGLDAVEQRMRLVQRAAYSSRSAGFSGWDRSA